MHYIFRTASDINILKRMSTKMQNISYQWDCKHLLKKIRVYSLNYSHFNLSKLRIQSQKADYKRSITYS